MTTSPLWIIGCPSYFGGADTELWDTMQLWAKAGIPLRLTPTWVIPDEWRKKCHDIGVEIVEVGNPDGLRSLPKLRGATVVSFCNGEFLKHAAIFRERECRIIWLGCMCWLFDAEKAHYKTHGPFDTYIFQSEHQKDTLLPQLAAFGIDENQTHVIHGPFNVDSFPYGPRPHAPNSEFYIGKLSRDDLGKFSSNLWPIYTRVPYAKRRARVMGWSERVEGKLGKPPEWAETLPGCKETAQAFLSSLHALVPVNGGAQENWPRVGLEAMSAGVPVVTQNQWGWREMIDHGRTGFLCDTDEDLAYYTAMLAYDEPLRLRITQNARAELVEKLANPATITEQWRSVLESASCG